MRMFKTICMLSMAMLCRVWFVLMLPLCLFGWFRPCYYAYFHVLMYDWLATLAWTREDR